MDPIKRPHNKKAEKGGSYIIVYEHVAASGTRSFKKPNNTTMGHEWIQ